MSERLKRLAPLIAKSELRGIKLAESSCHSLPAEMSESGELDVRLKWSARAVLKSAGAFSVLADIEVLLIPSGAADGEGARVWARFELRYFVPNDVELSEGLLEEFATTNGIFNAWSYWREYVQSTLSRMELPPLSLPLYRVPAEEQKPAGAARSSKAV